LSDDAKASGKVSYKLCGKYDGIDHPSGEKCCDPKCGALCGAANCHLGVGGEDHCCGKHIDQWCNKTHKAPCMISRSDLSDPCVTGLANPGENLGGFKCITKDFCVPPYSIGKPGGSSIGDCRQSHNGIIVTAIGPQKGQLHYRFNCCDDMEGLPMCNATTPTPCLLVPPINRILLGVLGLTTTKPDIFVNQENPYHSKVTVAIRDSIAAALLMPWNKDKVAILGISEPPRYAPVARRQLSNSSLDMSQFHLVSVGYNLTIPIGVGPNWVYANINSSSLGHMDKQVHDHLSVMLSHRGIPASIGTMSVPKPDEFETSMTATTTAMASGPTTTTTAMNCGSFDCPSLQVRHEKASEMTCDPNLGCTADECCVPDTTTTTITSTFTTEDNHPTYYHDDNHNGEADDKGDEDKDNKD
jgi:hypothetical protein